MYIETSALVSLKLLLAWRTLPIYTYMILHRYLLLLVQFIYGDTGYIESISSSSTWTYSTGLLGLDTTPLGSPLILDHAMHGDKYIHLYM